MISAHHRSPPSACFFGSPACLFACPGRHTTSIQAHATLPSPCPWRGEAGASFLDFPSPASQTKACHSPARKEPSKAQQGKAALPTRSSFVSVTRTARDCSSPSKSIPSQNRRFPLFDFITIIITSNPNAAAPQPFTLFGPPLDLYRTRKRGAVQSLDPLKIIETAVHQASSCPERLPTWRTTAITMATIAMACRTSAKTQQAFVTSSLLLLLHAAPHLPICLLPLQKFPPRSLP